MESSNRQISTLKFLFVMVGMVISGQYFGWNGGFEQASKLSYLVAVVILVIFYGFFMFGCAYLVNHYADKDKSLPDLVAVVLGRRFGYLCGWACVFEYWLATPAIAISFAVYLHELIPEVGYSYAVLIGFAIVFIANIGSLSHIAKYEAIATVIAIFGVIIFYFAIGSHALSLPSISNQLFDDQVTFSGVSYAISFAIWLFLGIEGGIILIHAMKNPKRNGFIGITFGVIILAFLALATVSLFVYFAQQEAVILANDPLPALLDSLHYPVIAKLILIFGLFGLLASFNGLTIGYSQQIILLDKSYRIMKSCSASRLKTKLISLIIPLFIALLCCLSNDLSQNFVVMSVLSAVIVYIFVSVAIVALFFKLKKWLMVLLYTLVLMLLMLIITFTFIYTIIPAHIQFLGLHVNIIWVLLAAFIIVILS
ncbi:amino acid permease, partial [Fangia hongkongensis]